MESSVLGVASSGRKKYKTIALLISSLVPRAITHTEKTFVSTCVNWPGYAYTCT